MSHLKGRPLKFLTFNSTKWRPLNETKTLLFSAIIAKIQDIGKEVATNLSASGASSALTSLSNVLPILNYRGSSQSSLLISWRNISPDWGWISSSPNWHWSHTLSGQPHYHKAAPDSEYWNSSNIPFCLCPLRETLLSLVPLPLFIY